MLLADSLKWAGIMPKPHQIWQNRLERIFIAVLCLVKLSIAVSGLEPRKLILLQGLVQLLLLPTLVWSGVYLRYKQIPRQLAPGKLSDFCLWVSAILIAATAAGAIGVRIYGAVVS